MKTAYLILGTALALSAAAIAGPGSTVRSPDSSASATQNGHSSTAAETGRKDNGMVQDNDSAEVTTTVRNGGNLASVTQSGDPTSVVKRVEKRPGYTRLEQHSGTNSSVIVQSDDLADLPLDKIPPALRGWLKR